MPTSFPTDRARLPSLSFILLCVFLGVLWLSGGASREDAIGQLVVRTAAWVVLIVVALFGESIRWREVRMVTYILAAAITLAVVQLVPLPPSLWQALPGREPFIEAAAASGQGQPWRPLAIVPGTAVNALASLVVPAAMLVLTSSLHRDDHRRLPLVILLFTSASALIALLQISGSGFDNPLVNDNRQLMSGNFANRNHFALFMAFGLAAIPLWAYGAQRPSRWRGPVGLTLALLYMLVILASGSRAGAILGAIALGVATVLCWRPLLGSLRGRPRWLPWAIATALGVIVSTMVLISLKMGRAVSIDRIFVEGGGEDLRSTARPVVLAMIREYFPAGGGLGGFDPLFRMNEPFDMLKLGYFNRAHNDYLEIALDTGLAGMLLVGAAIGWWLRASVRAWRDPSKDRPSLAKVGSTMLLLVLLASIFDYPARTPLIMAFTVLAAVWLSRAEAAALPSRGPPL